MYKLPKRFYRDKKNAKISGVCSGLADYTGVDPILIRVALVFLTVFSSGFLIIAYFVVTWLSEDKPEPDVSLITASDRIKENIADLDNRIQRLEASVTSSNSILATKIDAIK